MLHNIRLRAVVLASVFIFAGSKNLPQPAQKSDRAKDIAATNLCLAQILAVTSTISHSTWQEAGLLVPIGIRPV